MFSHFEKEVIVYIWKFISDENYFNHLDILKMYLIILAALSKTIILIYHKINITSLKIILIK